MFMAANLSARLHPESHLSASEGTSGQDDQSFKSQ
jgi:hypothetical protein